MSFAGYAGPATLTIGGMLARRALRSGRRLAVVSGDARVTFGELDERAGRAAALLWRAGVRKGDRVALLMRNGLTYCELFYAIGRIGAICCVLNHRLSASEIVHILADSEPHLLIYDQLFESIAEEVGPQFPGLAMLPLTARTQDGDAYASRLASISDGDFESNVAPADPLLLVYTSGTTGRPKGALITHEQLAWASLTIGHTVDFRAGDVHLLPVPMFHVGGLSFTVHVVHVGATVVIPPAWDASEILSVIDTERVNHFFAVPTMIADLLACPDFSPERLGSVRWIMSGAAPLPPALVDRFAAFGIPIQQSYGATETCGPAMCVDLDHVGSKRDCVGMPFFHTEVRLALENGREAAIGERAEVLVRARHVFSGYWRNDQATDAAFTDGWLRTGDIGWRDGDGYFYLVDRKSDMIITGGENVYPAEVEKVLATHSGVAEAAIVGLPDVKWGEIVCAVVTPTGEAPTLEALAAHCAAHLARYKIPRKLILRESLPRNATGKIQRAVLRRELTD